MNPKFLLFHALLFLLASCIPVTSIAPTTQITPAIQAAIVAEKPTPTPKVVVVYITSTPKPSDTPTITPTYTFTPTSLPTRTNDPSQVEWRGDLHIHTTCSDGWGTYDEIIQRAIELGFSFIAITDHLAFYRKSCQESIQKCREETRILCIPGSEESVGGQHHIIILGNNRSIIDDQVRMFKISKLKARIDEYHDQGWFAIAAHPQNDYTDDELIYSGLNAMECARGLEGYNQWQLEISEKFNIPCVYSSDAHVIDRLGNMYTICSIPINSLSDLKKALISGKCWKGGVY